MALVRAGRTPAELAREFEPTEPTIRDWAAQADRDQGLRSDGLTTAEKEELIRLRRENRGLEDRAGDPVKGSRLVRLRRPNRYPHALPVRER